MTTLLEWALGNDTGISSMTICAVMTGTPINPRFGPDVPHDPSDFGRCYRLLALFPTWRNRLPEVAERYPIWGPMVEAWDELTALYEVEALNTSGAAPLLYARMVELRDAGRLAAGWTQIAPGCWVGPSATVARLSKDAPPTGGASPRLPG